MAIVDISRKNKAEVLCALFDAAHPTYSKYSKNNCRHNTLTKSEAEHYLSTRTYFEYIKGHVMRIDLSGNKVNTTLFNLSNGPGAAERAINSVPDIILPKS